MKKTKEKGQMKEIITDYLRENPSFLYDQPEILENLYLPHSTGSAVSLVERQVGLLRERNSKLRSRLNILSSKAVENELLLEKTQSLILMMLDAKTLNQVIEDLNKCLSKDFSVEFCSLIIFGSNVNTKARGAKFTDYDFAKEHITSIVSSKILCGVVRDTELEFLFGKDASSIGSIAAVVIESRKPMAVLSIGHRDSNFYTSDTGTMFLAYLGKVLTRVLGQFLKPEESI